MPWFCNPGHLTWYHNQADGIPSQQVTEPRLLTEHLPEAGCGLWDWKGCSFLWGLNGQVTGEGCGSQDLNRQAISSLSFCLVWYQLQISHLWKSNRHITWTCQVNQSPIDLDQTFLLLALSGCYSGAGWQLRPQCHDLPAGCLGLHIHCTRLLSLGLEGLQGVCMVWQQSEPYKGNLQDGKHSPGLIMLVSLAGSENNYLTTKRKQPSIWPSGVKPPIQKSLLLPQKSLMAPHPLGPQHWSWGCPPPPCLALS